MKPKALLLATSLTTLLFFLASLASAQSLGEIARKVREEKKTEKKATKVFTNDNLPAGATAPTSVVGAAPAKSEGEAKEAKEGEAGTQGEEKKEGEEAKKSGHDEAYWRAKFAEQRSKIAFAEKEVDVLQRELNLMQQQYYSDPNEALRQQNTRGHINDQTQKINAKKDEIEKLKAGLAQLEDQLRQEGGDPGWAR